MGLAEETQKDEQDAKHDHGEEEESEAKQRNMLLLRAFASLSGFEQ